MKKIIFRADGNKNIGLGHIFRSLALAEALEVFNCSLYTQKIPDGISDQLKLVFNEVIALPTFTNIDEELNYFVTEKLRGNEIVVLDGYHFSNEYQRRIKEKGCLLVCIDDLQDVYYCSDVVINHSPGISVNDISAEPDTKIYLGPRYLILRKVFQLAILNQKIINELNTVFVCFGGSDPQNLTVKVITSLLQIESLKGIKVVLGSAFNQFEEIQKHFKNERVEFYVNLKAHELVSEMKNCDLAVCPASSIALETQCIGLKLITGFFAANQKHLAQTLHKNKIAYSVGNFVTLSAQELEEKIRTYIISRQWLNTNCLVKENSLSNLLKIFINLSTNDGNQTSASC